MMQSQGTVDCHFWIKYQFISPNITKDIIKYQGVRKLGSRPTNGSLTLNKLCDNQFVCADNERRTPR